MEIALKICSACGKPYEWAIKVKYENGMVECEHDMVSEKTKFAYKNYEEQKRSFHSKKNPFRTITGPK